MTMDCTEKLHLFIHSGISESVLEQAKSEYAQTTQDCMVTYATFLKEKYQQLSVFPDSEWPPSVGDQYIRLALIEHVNRLPNRESIRDMQEDILRGKVDVINGEKTPIHVSDVFAPVVEGKTLRVLMDGAPGVGKTTFCRKVSKDWACEAFLSEYKLVVVLHLRDRRIAKAKRIEDLLYCDDPELQGEVIRQVRKTSGAGVLLIFDGFDELSEEERMDKSLFLDIIKGEVLSRCSVLVTSRPYASENLQCLRSIARHVEVLGFTEEQIYQCITNAIKDETNAQVLVNMLKQRADVISLCYIPLNCSILLYVYQQQDFTLPDTLSDFFEVFVLHTLKRDAKVRSAHRLARKICNLISLPSPLSDNFNHLCKLAFDGLVNNRMVFQYEEVETAVCMLDEDLESKFLGLLTAFKSFPSVGDNMTYQFLHLTIQEFLAARWLATHMLPEEQAKFFMDNLFESRFRMMLLFLAGISKLDNPSFSILFSAKLDFLIPFHEMNNFFPGSHSNIIEPENLFFHLLHFIYESQNPSHCHTLACAIEEQTIILRRTVPHFLFLAIAFAFFLQMSNCTWKRLDIGTLYDLDILLEQLEKESPSVGSVGFQQLQVTDVTNNTQGIVIGASSVTVKQLARIVNIPVFRQLQKLEIMGSHHLSCYNSEVYSSHLESLRGLMRNGTLEELVLYGVSGVDDKLIEKCIAPELATTTTLKVLDIGSLSISSKGFCRLFEALKCNKSLEILLLHNMMHGDLRSLALAVETALQMNQTLKTLSFRTGVPSPHPNSSALDITLTDKLSQRSVSTVGIAQYAEKLYSGMFRALKGDNSTLKSLAIANTSFVVDEKLVQPLIGMLLNNKSLTSLSIIVGCLPYNFLHVLAIGLTRNTSLTRLCIRSRCAISDPSLVGLAYVLHQNSTLKTLILDLNFETKDCVVGAENFTSFLGMLLWNRSLTSITFMYRFSDEQLKAIAHHLVLNGHIHEIELVFEHPYWQSVTYNFGVFTSEGHHFIPCLYSYVQGNYELAIQEEVNKYKKKLFELLYFVYHVYEIYHRPL